MSFPEEVPCPCDACDNYSLMADDYCIECVHHGCSYNAPRCPSMQRSPRWCDICHDEKETAYIERQHVCEDCTEYISVSSTTIRSLKCDFCGERMGDAPWSTYSGREFSEPEEYTYESDIVHPACFEERSRIRNHVHSHKTLDKFV